MSSLWTRILQRYVAAGPSDAESGASPRKRYAALLLVAGGVAVGALVMPHLPREREVELRLDDAGSVTAVDVSWSAAGKPDAVRGASWRFSVGKAPAKLATRVSLVDGRYELDVLIERGEERETLHRVIAVGDSDHITVRLR